MTAFAETAAFPFRLLLPETILAGGLLATLLTSLGKGPAWRKLAATIAAAAAIGAFVASLDAGAGAVGTTIAGDSFVDHTVAMLRVDAIATIVRPAITALLALCVFARSIDRDDAGDGEAWHACTLGIGLGALLVTSAANTIPMWLGLELVSLGSYALAAWRGGDRRAAEAGMKYVLFGGAATGLMLFGTSHLYGLTGHLDFAGIGHVLGQGASPATAAALCLAAVGAAYKLTVVPFHVYAPDVYQGAPPTSVAVVATLPKLAAGAVLLRALPLVLPANVAPPGTAAAGLAIVAFVSLAVGAVMATVQRDARRILAFSGIGHGGTAVLAMAAMPGATSGGAASATLLQLLAYAAAAFGAFVCLGILERDTNSTDLEALRGAGRRRPWTTGALCLFLASLVGIPPLAGFLAKWAVIAAAVAAGPWPFAAVGALLVTTAVFAFAYLRIVRAAVLTEPAHEIPCAPPPWPATLAVVVAALVVLGLGLWLDVLAVLTRELAS